MARLNYLSASNRKYLPPSIGRHSLFGWLPTVYRITEDEVIQYAGLDAYVFLGFFKMAIKLLSVCWLFSAAVISPIRYYFTGDYDDDSGKHPGKDEPAVNDTMSYSFLPSKKNPIDIPIDSRAYLALYVIFTYVFTLVALHFLTQQAAKVIKRRQEVLGHQSSVTDRTIRLTGVPPELRSERALKETIDSLGIGKAEKIVICKEWKKLDQLYKQRARILERLERAWAEYLGNGKSGYNVRPFAASSYPLGEASANSENSGDQTADQVGMFSESGEQQQAHYHDVESQTEPDTESVHRDDDLVPSDFVPSTSVPSSSATLKRPLVRTGFLNMFGRKVDAIDYYTQQLRAVDGEILEARTRHYAATPTAFVTLDSVAAAQMFAQAVLDPRIGFLITTPAPAPRDIIWENLTLPHRGRALKQAYITVVTGLLAVAFIVPVGYLATLLNLKTIRKFWPALGELLDGHPWTQDFVVDLLPVYLYTLLNFVIPYIYVWVSSKQGFVSYGEEELSVVSKNFFYVFVNMFLVFTMAGTASNYWGYLSDSKKLALQLAASLRGLSSFYVDTILLQGLGMQPFKLLLFGQLFNFSFFRASCKTPRHYMQLYKPPLFNFGLNLPIPLLTLIITLLYSVMSTKILSAGLAYFIVGFYVYKFQLIYSCIHPQHSTGQVMPIIFRRVILGLLLFQLTVAGSLALSNAWILSLCLTPLPFITLTSLWYFQKNYQPLSYFIALRAIEKDAEEGTSSVPSGSLRNRRLSKKSSTIDERREFNQTYTYPNLLQSLDGPWLAIEGDQIVMATTDGIKRKKLMYEEY
ncbi:DEKNAAC105399 [Brettanomyces naardenensis]|uniref:DEKNAAC105399 n=1 Tax=Brettanomyces naardenensis TaxID=13370 RepID=A0A448YT63_BRENA|nr:DEKNAAC105399 [Brettanomyces naardenensis]